ncbi:MAG: hypothetical protein C4523_00955 [Myxococcales bacterium]|nr:MAG: hypothetical protein C4523_00955 [Myxococcales bacterium]
MTRDARKPNKRILVGGVAAALAAALLLLAVHAASSPATPAGFSPAREPSEEELRYGLQPDGVFLSAGGYILDFRYRVLDAEKAAAIINRQVAPVLTDVESGARFLVPNTPKVGALRQTRMGPKRDGKHQFMLFANPSGRVKRGQTVRVSIGDFTTGELQVR